jgi:hypothetical protein
MATRSRPSRAARCALRVRRHRPGHKRWHYLKEIVAAGPKAQTAVEAVQARLVAEVVKRRKPGLSPHRGVGAALADVDAAGYSEP